MNSLTLHAQFDIIKLKLHLKHHPQDAHRLAIEHFQDYLEVVERYKKLEEENQKLKSPSLPPFPTQSHGRLQKNYDELLDSYTELSADFLNLTEENKALIQLLDALTNDDFDLPLSVKRRQGG